MRVLHVVPSFYPAHYYGGPIESVHELCRHSAAQGCEVRVLTTTADGPDHVVYPKTTVAVLPGSVQVTYCKRLGGDSVSASLLRLLPQHIHWADVIHLTAVYSFPTIPVLLAARVANKPVVWSPRGALQRWSGSTKVGLKKWWDRTCGLVSSQRVVLHVTSAEEARESREAYPRTPAAVIPNGVSIPESLNREESDDMLRLLFVGRLHPKKGIENLLAACSRLDAAAGAPWPWLLTIAGGGDPRYTTSLQELVSQLGLSDRVQMIGQVSGPSKQRLFERSDLLVTPSYTENFGMVVAESLAHEVPVIASHHTPWEALEAERCGLWVNNDPDTLAASILHLRQCALRDMGRRGRVWMTGEFSWAKRTAEMLDLYGQLILTEERGPENEHTEPAAAHSGAVGRGS